MSWRSAIAAVSVVALIGGCLTVPKEETPMNCVVLEGTPEEVGREFAKLNGDKIKADFERFTEEHKDLLETGKRYVEITEQLAPHWLAEASAVAREIGVDPTLYGIYLGAKYRGVNSQHECISYAARPEVTQDGRPLLHKLRQNRFRLQGAYFKKVVVEGKDLHKFFRVGDVHGLEPCMFVNDKGLASCHVQCGSDPHPRRQGWMTHSMSRYIAESASTCQEALEILEMTSKKGYYAGNQIGTRWTFADASGSVVTALQHAEKVSMIDWATDTGFVLNKGTFPTEADLPLNALAMNEALREETGLCSLTAEVHKEYPEFLTCAWVSLGNPANVYVPLFMGGQGTPVTIADGTLHLLNRSTDRARMAAEAHLFEERAEARRQEVEHQAACLLKKGRRTKATRLLTKFNAEITLAAQEFVQSLPKAEEE